MDQDESEVGARVAEDKTPEQIRREIEDTRQDLGDTAAALAAKTDVKARAKEKVEGIKQTVSEKKESFTSSSSSADPTGGGSQGSPLDQVKAKAPEFKAKAQENPIPTAAIAAFIGGFIFGRLTSR
jgi:hypothetical protein